MEQEKFCELSVIKEPKISYGNKLLVRIVNDAIWWFCMIALVNSHA